ncbi:MAG TPA: ring-cleaving dioxygenase [Chitinophagaceae bacterium]
MENRILGLHHITAIAGQAQRNYDFYTGTLGLRLVKKTVNYDDPGTYHFYFGDTTGSPGTILTFFPWEDIQKGRPGNGMATEIGYAVPAGSLDFWKERLKSYQLQSEQQRFGESYIRLEDPDGLILNLVVPADADERKPWTGNGVQADAAIRGFHNVTLNVRRLDPTASVLTDIFGYTLKATEDNRHRFVTDAISTANIVDIVEDPHGPQGINAGGTNHHVAFRVKDDNILMEFREKVIKKGLHITEKIDRNYFYSLYFREPGGILFEIASDNPGFLIDESLEKLGSQLMLPPQYEVHRDRIEAWLPEIPSDVHSNV